MTTVKITDWIRNGVQLMLYIRDALHSFMFWREGRSPQENGYKPLPGNDFKAIVWSRFDLGYLTLRLG